MRYSFHLDLDPLDADQRQVAEWLSGQPDPTAAVVRLVKAALDGDRRLAQWEELAALLADEIKQVRAQLSPRPLARPAPPPPPVQENPESARRLDSMFG